MMTINASDIFETLWMLSWLGALLTAPNVLLQRAGRPIAAVSWLLALFALPALALAAWWLFGRVHLRGRTRMRRRSSQSTLESLSQTRLHMLESIAEASIQQQPVSLLAPNLSQDTYDNVFPATPGNQVLLLSSRDAIQQTWLQLIQEAKHHLHLLFYSWRDDRIGRMLCDLLSEKATQGVQVRVLYDAVGSFGLSSGFFKGFIKSGGQLARFMPVRLASATPTLNFRNHRKLIIADSRKAYTGGVNVGEEFLGWQDVGIVIHGPGINQLQEAFVDDWYFTTGEELSGGRYFWDRALISPPVEGDAICETIASGPDQTFNATREMVFLAITQCRHRLWITTPLFFTGRSVVVGSTHGRIPRCGCTPDSPSV